MIKSFFIGILFCGISYADCDFFVINNSSQPISVEAGYFGENNKVIFTIDQATSKNVIIKSDLKCDYVTRSGLGMTYINLIDGKSTGGWVYDPLAGIIRANGIGSKDANGRIGIAKNGIYLFLLNTINPASGHFVVQIKNPSRNISRQLGSMD